MLTIIPQHTDDFELSINIIHNFQHFNNGDIFSTETYSGICQTSMMKLLCENSERLKADK